MNTLTDWKTTAKIIDPERKAFWESVFDTDRVPIKSFIPTRADLPGHPDALIYELDLQAITPEQRKCLIQGLAERFNLAPEYVARSLECQGVPIWSDHVIISTTDRAMMGMLLD